MKKVLMINYCFPPLGGVGVIRTLKFAKYLPLLGWKPLILTVKDPPGIVSSSFFGASLTNLEVYRSVNIPLDKLFKGKYDIYPGWIPASINLGAKIVKKEKIDAIYASYPYAENFLIAACIKKITGRPLVIDYRDAWSNNWFRYPLLQYMLQKKLEEWIIHQADEIIATNHDINTNLRSEFPFVEDKKVNVITNGYDHEDFKNLSPMSFDKFTVLHVGSMAKERAEKFHIFLQALKNLESNIKGKLQVIALGGLSSTTMKLLGDLKLTSIVKSIEPKPHKEAIRYMLGADILLLVPAIEQHLPLKIFEYLATGNFILNLSSPDSEAGQLIQKYGHGISVKPNATSIENALVKCIAMRKPKKHIAPAEFSFKTLTAKLSIQLNSALEKQVRSL